VHPKFDTGAEENLWRAACGPRAALWPPLNSNPFPHALFFSRNQENDMFSEI